MMEKHAHRFVIHMHMSTNLIQPKEPKSGQIDTLYSLYRKISFSLVDFQALWPSNFKGNLEIQNWLQCSLMTPEPAEHIVLKWRQDKPHNFNYLPFTSCKGRLRGRKL